jgi:hypothetical protein
VRARGLRGLLLRIEFWLVVYIIALLWVVAFLSGIAA